MSLSKCSDMHKCIKQSQEIADKESEIAALREALTIGTCAIRANLTYAQQKYEAILLDALHRMTKTLEATK